MNVKESSKSFAKEGSVFIILNFEFKTIKNIFKTFKKLFPSFANDFERSQTFMNVHEPSRRELLNDQNCTNYYSI
jgi:hypothetical protein